MTIIGPNPGETQKPSNPESTAWSSVGDEVPFRGKPVIHDFDQEQGLRDVVEEEFEGFIDEPRQTTEPTPETTDEQVPKPEVNSSNPETKAPEEMPSSFQVAPGVTAESQFESITGEKVTSVTATGRIIGDKFYAELADTTGEDDYPIETWVIRERTELEPKPTSPEDEEMPSSFQVAPGVTAESQFESITGEKVTSVTATGRIIGDKFYAELADTTGEDDYPIETWIIHKMDTQDNPQPTGGSVGNPNVDTHDDTANDGQGDEQGGSGNPGEDNNDGDAPGESSDNDEDQEDQPKNPELDFDEQIDRCDKARVERLEKEAEKAKLEAEKAKLKAEKLELELDIAKLQLESERQAPSKKRRRISVLNWLFNGRKKRAERQAATSSSGSGESHNDDSNNDMDTNELLSRVDEILKDNAGDNNPDTGRDNNPDSVSQDDGEGGKSEKPHTKNTYLEREHDFWTSIGDFGMKLITDEEVPSEDNIDRVKEWWNNTSDVVRERISKDATYQRLADKLREQKIIS